MKKRRMHLIVGCTMFVLCISICTTTANATVIWEDNFDDPSLDDWTIYGYESLDSEVKIEGNFSAASGMLEVLDNDVNVARHDSDVTVGTWSFDMFVPDDDDGTIYVELMSNGADLLMQTNSSLVMVGAWLSRGKFILWEMIGTTTDILKDIFVDSLHGWHHIEVSRTSDGRFLVYFNGTLEADVVSNDVTSSTYFSFWCEDANGAAIDNVVVEEASTPLPWELIAIGGGAVVVVIVLAIVFLRRR